MGQDIQSQLDRSAIAGQLSQKALERYQHSDGRIWTADMQRQEATLQSMPCFPSMSILLNQVVTFDYIAEILINHFIQFMIIVIISSADKPSISAFLRLT